MDVLMPQLGETVSEGKVLVWYKQVGDKVEPIGAAQTFRVTPIQP
jgi:hypothetical protein